VQLAADPVVVARYTTRPLPGIGPQMLLLLFSDSPYRFWIREEKGGLLIGGGDPRPLPADRLVDADAPPCAQALPPDHALRTRQYVRQIEHVMPILQEAEINAVRAGLPCYTADRLFAASAVDQAQGLYVLAACNEAGITHGPALGRHMAECIVDGVTSLDGSRFDIVRL
jgi:sarcosine oxidase subunit beta